MSVNNVNMGGLKNLAPEEINTIKGQIGAMLNYSARGANPAKVPDSIRSKISDADAKAIVENVAKYLHVNAKFAR